MEKSLKFSQSRRGRGIKRAKRKKKEEDQEQEERQPKNNNRETVT